MMRTDTASLSYGQTIRFREVLDDERVKRGERASKVTLSVSMHGMCCNVHISRLIDIALASARLAPRYHYL
jgi:uncharacterized membrane protein